MRRFLPFAFALVACTSPEDPGQRTLVRPDDEGPKPSDSFVATCARCHGPRGEGTTGVYPAIPGALDEATFIATVRSGKGRAMPAFSPEQVPDDHLKNDYAWLKTLRAR
jgi:mono/diheme cytochrome c family protein